VRVTVHATGFRVVVDNGKQQTAPLESVAVRFTVPEFPQCHRLPQCRVSTVEGDFTLKFRRFPHFPQSIRRMRIAGGHSLDSAH
jgi:hypothetical protein